MAIIYWTWCKLKIKAVISTTVWTVWRIRRRAKLGGASWPRWGQPGPQRRGRRPHQWCLPPLGNWTQDRTTSPTLQCQSSAGSPSVGQTHKLSLSAKNIICKRLQLKSRMYVCVHQSSCSSHWQEAWSHGAATITWVLDVSKTNELACFGLLWGHSNFDFWPPNQFFLESKWIVVPVVKDIPSRCSWDVAFIRIARTDGQPIAGLEA